MVRDRHDCPGAVLYCSCFKSIGHPDVQSLTTGKTQISEQALAELLMHEYVLGLALPRHLADQPERFSLFERIEDGILARSGNGQQQVERERSADHRCVGQNPAGIRR